MSPARSPFSPRAALALVLGGALLFVALLWLIGAGLGSDNTNRGEATVGGRGLNGYAALAAYLDQRGYAVSHARTVPALRQPGLLVLTPPAAADGAELTRIVEARRRIGPTLVITPKWLAVPLKDSLRAAQAGARPGWVTLLAAELPEWSGFYDDLSVQLKPMRSGGMIAAWRGADTAGALPNSEHVLSGSGERLVPLVVGDTDGRVLAGFIQDEGDYPGVSDMAAGDFAGTDPDEADLDVYPVAFVFEPDLLNNYGFADVANARLAERLVDALDDTDTQSVVFDLTLNGYGRSPNLLTLAFKPPFLAATLCLLLAALVLGWRAFLRFGPPLRRGPTLAFGKRALVGNAAGLLRRAQRLHLTGQPYADAARERIARALALPHRLDPAATEAAIDRALAARAPSAPPFSAAAATMRAARRPVDLVRAAQVLHSLERTLKR